MKCAFSDDSKLSFFLRVPALGSSVKITAVAGTVLGTRNPLFSSELENTDNTTAPGIPITREETSARTVGF